MSETKPVSAPPPLLDKTQFERVVTTDDYNGSILEPYKAVYARSTMVLFSQKTRSPLAALTLKADDVGYSTALTTWCHRRLFSGNAIFARSNLYLKYFKSFG